MTATSATNQLNSPNQTDVDQATHPESLGYFKTGEALRLLYDHAEPLMTKSELEFMARSIGHAALLAQNMAKIVLSSALVCLEDESGFFGREEEKALLVHVSEQFEQIDGLIWIGEEARYRLQTMDTSPEEHVQEIPGGAK